MDGFGDALNGYYDPADGMTRYLRSRADEGFADARERKRAIESQAAFEERRDAVRERFRAAIGDLPDRPEDPDAETTGRVERDGYSIQGVVFESRPDFHVTANCYVPDGEGPFPGVLFLPGHVDEAKVDPYNQRACVELASNGVVVLALDPVSQGERRQYVDPETGEPRFGGSGGVVPHCLAGQRLFYAGANLARYMIHDDRRGLDYLLGRPEVDGDRVGVTGTSGGGLRTLYLALLDDRIDAAAPCCCVTTRREWLKTGKRIDAEQVIPGAIPGGIDYDDLLAAMAPDPVLLGAAASDRYFPIEGVHEAVERVRRVYDLYDAAENLDLTVADENHCSVYEIGDEVFAFLCDALDAGAYDPVDDPETLDPSELHCTPDGDVIGAYPNERTIEGLIRTYVAETYPEAGDAPVAGGDDEDAADLRRTVAETLDLDRGGCDPHPRFVDRSGESDGEDELAVDRVWFRTERDPDAVVAGVLVSDPETTADAPAVVLYENGTEELPDRTEDVAALAREHGAVLVFDPRGVGAVRNRHVPIPPWVDGYDGFYGTEFKLAYDAVQLGTSLLGMRTYDALRAAAFLRSETGADRVSFVGEGVGAYHALYAAAAAEDVARVALRDLDHSFYDLATEPEAPYRPEITAFDVLGECDVPRVTAALDRRGVRVSGGPGE